jgi:disulfide bond formation protein DsbB
MIMTKPVYRKIQSTLLLITLFVLTTALYFEYGKGMQPCPLCLMQRLCTFLFGLFCMTGLFSDEVRRARRVTIFQMVFAVFGIYFASRQIWLQSLPADAAPACMPSLDILIHYFSGMQVLTALLWGTGDCADVTWRFLGLSMPVWSAIYFVAMLLTCAYVFRGLGRRLAETGNR